MRGSQHLRVRLCSARRDTRCCCCNSVYCCSNNITATHTHTHTFIYTHTGKHVGHVRQQMQAPCVRVLPSALSLPLPPISVCECERAGMRLCERENACKRNGKWKIMSQTKAMAWGTEHGAWGSMQRKKGKATTTTSAAAAAAAAATTKSTRK